MFECLVPRQGAARLVFNDASLEEIAFFLQVNHFAHPWEGVLFVGEEGFQANLRGTAVGDVAQIAFEHGRLQQILQLLRSALHPRRRSQPSL